jgi:glycyl-tRNA synthetase beta chain
VAYVVKKIAQVPARKILSEIIQQVVSNLDIPKGMRWEQSSFTFYRPVRWVLALFEADVIALRLGSVKSGRYTYGHRQLHPQKIRVNSWRDYFDRVQKAYVVFDEGIRKKLILTLARKQLMSGETISESALGGLVNLVEYPRVARCNFPRIEWDLPDEVISVIVEQIKAVPIFYEGKLKKEFLIVADGVVNAGIKRNYEEIVRSRILDAEFFYHTDLAKPFETFHENLKKIIFHPKWGSLYAKADRLSVIAEKFSAMIHLQPEESTILKRAALLCKNDLASEVVREMPDLHGTMGAIYARHWGECEEVCAAIQDHVKPRVIGNAFPATKPGMLLGLIDRLDYICAFLAADAEVTGSEDPYGLRRVAAGFFEVVRACQFNCEFTSVVREIAASFSPEGVNEIASKVRTFLLQRFEAVLASEGIPRGLRSSVLEVEEMNFHRVRRKIEALKTFIRENPDSEMIFVPVARIANILRQAKERNIAIPPFNAQLLAEPEEAALNLVFEENGGRVYDFLRCEDYSSFLGFLLEIKEPVDRFFDRVLVMCPDETLRNNRLALLKKFNDLFLMFADFSTVREEDIRNVKNS